MLVVLHRTINKSHLLLNHPFWLVIFLPRAIAVEPLADRNLRQADILHHGPNDSQTTAFRGEGVNLIRALPDIAKQAFNGVGASDVAMHDRRKGIKSQQVLFIFAQAPDSFRVAQAIFGECSPPD